MTAPLEWRVPQEFETAFGDTVRSELVRLIACDLLGPWNGELEEFAPRAAGPRDRYLVGMLGPRTIPGRSSGVEPGQADTETGGDTDGEADLPDVLSPQLGRIWASSMGLSFAVDRTVTSVAVEASWAAYERAETTQEDGRSLLVWRRIPVRHTTTVAVGTPGDARVWLTDETGDPFGIWLTVQVRDHVDPGGYGQRVVRLTLVNAQRGTRHGPTRRGCTRSRITVTALDGGRRCSPRSTTRPRRHRRRRPGGAAPAAALPRPPAARVGHNVAVHADRRDGARAAWRLETTWLPHHDVPQRRRPRTPVGAGRAVDGRAGGPLMVGPRRCGLRGARRRLRRWLADQALVPLSPPVQRPDRRAIRADGALGRLRAGIELLATNPQALAAFGFANRVMALQRRHTGVALRERDVSLLPEALAKVEGPATASWRPFQLAFVLLNLPSLTDPGHPSAPRRRPRPSTCCSSRPVAARPRPTSG